METNELPTSWQDVIVKLGEGQRLVETLSEWAYFQDETKVYCDDLALMAEEGIVDYEPDPDDACSAVFFLTEEGDALRQELVTA